jgi:hypothetical protein
MLRGETSGNVMAAQEGTIFFCNLRNWGAKSNQNVKKLTCSAKGGSAQKQAGI